MLLQKDSNPELNTVTAYGDHYLEVNRVRFEGAICFAPWGEVHAASVNSLADIDTAYLKSLIGVDEASQDPMAFLDDAPPALPENAPEILLIGTGRRQAFLPVDVIAPIQALGIGIETMTTQAAARTYNILMSEERRVLALMLPGDPDS